MSIQRQKFSKSSRIYSSKYLRVFQDKTQTNSLEVSVSKKFFRLAVERNRVKRRIKEIYRKNKISSSLVGRITFAIFGPFGELSYNLAEKEILRVLDKNEVI
ncbi:MAG: ribonuclease P protein component [Gammaproteobacteria bacterium]|nr:ribonuclease P protein component [Gammaproteobacteria bacterium]